MKSYKLRVVSKCACKNVYIHCYQMWPRSETSFQGHAETFAARKWASSNALPTKTPPGCHTHASMQFVCPVPARPVPVRARRRTRTVPMAANQAHVRLLAALSCPRARSSSNIWLLQASESLRRAYEGMADRFLSQGLDIDSIDTLR